MSFLTNRSFAPLAAKLPVECVELLLLRGELVLIPFDCLQRQRGIHLDERHSRIVRQEKVHDSPY
jgi:hypothetical protein